MNQATLLVALNDADPEVRQAAILEVAENPQITLSEPSLDALISCLGAGRKAIQRRAAEALAASALHDPRVVEKLRAMFAHPDPRARWGAVYALGLVTLDDALDLRAMAVLLDTLASNDGDVRWAAAELIVRLGGKNPATVSAQLVELAGHGNLNARKMALYCLRDVGGPHDALLAVAESCCGDQHTLLKMAALSLLARIHHAGDRAAALAIRLLQGDPDGGVRRCAAVALGHLGNHAPFVTDALTCAANAEGDIYMQRAAQGALTRLGANP